jgi:shikimate dehydrogenase
MIRCCWDVFAEVPAMLEFASPALITGKTKLLGVIGQPIGHSLSPIMHNAAIAHLNQSSSQTSVPTAPIPADYIYVAFPVSDLAAALGGFEAIGVQGFNVTIPYKQAIMPLLDEISPVAQAVGAVNTVWRTAAGWQGTNTDIAGFLKPLISLGQTLPTQTAVVLGAGGAARAVVAGCAALGFGRIDVVGRDRPKLAQFAQSWPSRLEGRDDFLSHCLRVHSWDALDDLLPQASLLVNTTPLGMAPQTEQCPLTAAQIDLLPSKGVVYDLIYVPNPTGLLKLAQQRDLIAIDGLEMLVQQGAAALQIWLNQPPPVEVMRRSLQAWLGL